MLGPGSHERLNGPAFFPFGLAERTDGVVSSRGRNNKSLRIVNDERIEGASRAFDHCFSSLYKVEDIDAARSSMWHGTRKPMATGLDKLAFVESGLLLSPSGARTEGRDLIYEVMTHPVCRAIPLDISRPVIEVNWPR